MTQRNSNTSAFEFNRLFTPNTPCFYRPVRTEDKWHPTRTRSEAYHDDYLMGLAVRIDGSSAPVLVTQLAMPGSSVFDENQHEADQVWEDWVNQAADMVAENAQAPKEQQEHVVYQYVAAVATPNGFIHYDGILHGPMISGIEDYHRYRAEMASDAGVQPEQIQVRSLAIVGMAPLVPKNDG